MAAGGVAPRRIKKIARAHAVTRDIAMMVGVKSVDPDLSQNDRDHPVAASELTIGKRLTRDLGASLCSPGSVHHSPNSAANSA
jgi:hypothetical protein